MKMLLFYIKTSKYGIFYIFLTYYEIIDCLKTWTIDADYHFHRRTSRRPLTSFYNYGYYGSSGSISTTQLYLTTRSKVKYSFIAFYVLVTLISYWHYCLCWFVEIRLLARSNPVGELPAKSALLEECCRVDIQGHSVHRFGGWTDHLSEASLAVRSGVGYNWM